MIRKTKIWFSGFRILALLFPLLSFSQPVDNSMVIDKILVKVNDEIVLKSELDIAVYQVKNQPNSFPQDDMECSVLQNLVINKMLLAQAEIDSVVVDDAMVEDQLERRMQYFAMQFGSFEKIEQVYGKPINELKDELRPQLRDQMVVQKMQDNLMNKVKVTPSEVRAFYNQIPKDSIPYFSTEVQVGQLIKYPEISKDQKKKAYDFLMDLKKQIQDGADFSEMAMLHSQDPGTAQSGGELGYFPKGDLVPEYEAAAMKLADNEISNPVESEFGFHLIQMLGRKGNTYNTRHILIKPSAAGNDDNTAIEFLKDIKSKIENDSISFERAAKKHSEDKNSASTGGMFVNPATASTSLPMDQIEPEVFFIIDTMKVGAVTDPVPYTARDGKKGFRILYLKSKTEPHYANLKDDYTKISEAALNDKKASALETWFKKTVKNLYISVDPEYEGCNLLN